MQNPMDTLIAILILIAVVSLLIWLIYRLVVKVGTTLDDTSNKKAQMTNYFSNMKNFSVTQQIISPNNELGMAIDEATKKVCLIKYDDNQKVVLKRIFSYRDLLSIEVIENGEIITSTVRSSQLSGALIGGLALGGIGAVIGGLSGKTKKLETVDKIALRLRVNDISDPLFELNLLPFKIKRGSIFEPTITLAMQNAHHWQSLIEILIKRADTEDRENEKNHAEQDSSNSIADELKKLAELRDSGVLSDAEFQQQKEKLLG